MLWNIENESNDYKSESESEHEHGPEQQVKQQLHLKSVCDTKIKERKEEVANDNANTNKNINLIDALKLMNRENAFRMSVTADDIEKKKQCDAAKRKKKKKKKKKEKKNNENTRTSRSRESSENSSLINIKSNGKSIEERKICIGKKKKNTNRKNRNMKERKQDEEIHTESECSNMSVMKQDLMHSIKKDKNSENIYNIVGMFPTNEKFKEMYQTASGDVTVEALKRKALHKGEMRERKKKRRKTNKSYQFLSRNYNLLANVDGSENEHHNKNKENEKLETEGNSSDDADKQILIHSESVSNIGTESADDSDTYSEFDVESSESEGSEKEKRKQTGNINMRVDNKHIPGTFVGMKNSLDYALGKNRKKKRIFGKDKNSVKNKFQEFSFLSYRKEIANLYEKEKEVLNMTKCAEENNKNTNLTSGINETNSNPVEGASLLNNDMNHFSLDNESSYFRLRCNRSVIDKFRGGAMKHSVCKIKNANSEKDKSKKEKKKQKKKKKKKQNYEEKKLGIVIKKSNEQKNGNMDQSKENLITAEKVKSTLEIFKNFINYTKLKKMHDLLFQHPCDSKTMAKMTRCVIHKVKKNVDYRVLEVYLVCSVDKNHLEATLYSVKKQKALFDYIFTPDKIDYMVSQFEKAFNQKIKRTAFLKLASKIFLTKRDYLKCVETIARFAMAHNKTTYAAYAKQKSILDVVRHMLEQESINAAGGNVKYTTNCRVLKDEHKTKAQAEDGEDEKEEGEKEEEEEVKDDLEEIKEGGSKKKKNKKKQMKRKQSEKNQKKESENNFSYGEEFEKGHSENRTDTKNIKGEAHKEGEEKTKGMVEYWKKEEMENMKNMEKKEIQQMDKKETESMNQLKKKESIYISSVESNSGQRHHLGIMSIKSKEHSTKTDVKECEIEQMKKLIKSNETMVNMLYDQHKLVLQQMKQFMNFTINESGLQHFIKKENGPQLLSTNEVSNEVPNGNVNEFEVSNKWNMSVHSGNMKHDITRLENQKPEKNPIKLYSVKEIRNFERKIKGFTKVLERYMTLTFKKKQFSQVNDIDEFDFVNFDDAKLEIDKLFDQVNQALCKIENNKNGVLLAPQRKLIRIGSRSNRTMTSLPQQTNVCNISKAGMMNILKPSGNVDREQQPKEYVQRVEHPMKRECDIIEDTLEKNYLLTEESLRKREFLMPNEYKKNCEMLQNVSKLYDFKETNKNESPCLWEKINKESGSDYRVHWLSTQEEKHMIFKDNRFPVNVCDQMTKHNADFILKDSSAPKYPENNRLKNTQCDKLGPSEDGIPIQNLFVGGQNRKDSTGNNTENSFLSILMEAVDDKTKHVVEQPPNKEENKVQSKDIEKGIKQKGQMIRNAVEPKRRTSYLSFSEFDMAADSEKKEGERQKQKKKRGARKRKNKNMSNEHLTKKQKEKKNEKEEETGQKKEQKKERKKLKKKQQKKKEQMEININQEMEKKKSYNSGELLLSNENKRNECKAVNINKLITNSEGRPLSDRTEVLVDSDASEIYEFNLYSVATAGNDKVNQQLTNIMKVADMRNIQSSSVKNGLVDTAFDEEEIDKHEKGEEKEEVEKKEEEEEEEKEEKEKEEEVEEEKEVQEKEEVDTEHIIVNEKQVEVDKRKKRQTLKRDKQQEKHEESIGNVKMIKGDKYTMNLQLMKEAHDYSFVELDSDEKNENVRNGNRNIYEEYITQEEAIRGIMTKKYVRGIVSVKNCDYAYVMFDGKKLHINSKREINRALDGDVVVAEVYGRKKKIKELVDGGYQYEYEDTEEGNDTFGNNMLWGKDTGKGLKGKIVYIEEHGGTDTYYVCLFRDKLVKTGTNMAVPFKKNIPLIRVSGENVFSYMEKNNISNIKGHLVHIKVFRWERNQQYPEGKIKEMLGANDILHNMQRAILLNRNLEYNLKEAVEDSYVKELCDENVYKKIFEDEKRKRLDLTDYTICTIDPESARDLDDAVHICRIKKKKLLASNYYIQVVHNLIEHNGEIEESILKKNISLFVNDDTSFFDQLKQDNSVKEMEGIKKYNFRQEKEEQAEKEEEEMRQMQLQMQQKKNIKRYNEQHKKTEKWEETNRERGFTYGEREEELEFEEEEGEEEKEEEDQDQEEEQEEQLEFEEEEEEEHENGYEDRDTESVKGKKFRTTFKKIDSDSSELDFLKILSEQEEPLTNTDDDMEEDIEENPSEWYTWDESKIVKERGKVEMKRKGDRPKMTSSNKMRKTENDVETDSSLKSKELLGIPMATSATRKKRKKGEMIELWKKKTDGKEEMSINPVGDNDSYVHNTYTDDSKEGQQRNHDTSGNDSTEKKGEYSDDDYEELKQIITFQNMFLEKEKEREKRRKRRGSQRGKGIRYYYSINDKKNMNDDKEFAEQEEEYEEEEEEANKKEERIKKKQMKEILMKLFSKTENVNNYYMEEKEEDIGSTVMDHDLFCEKCNKYINVEEIKKIVEKDKDEKYNLYEVGVHITDVSFFVKENSSLDIDARNRAMTIYLTHTCFPMLSRVLSENLCSLDPRCGRLCVSVFFYMDSSGKLDHNSFFFRESIINSKIRFTYEEVYIAVKTYMRLKNKMKKIKQVGLCGYERWKEKRLRKMEKKRELLKDADIHTVERKVYLDSMQTEIQDQLSDKLQDDAIKDSSRQVSTSSIPFSEKEEIKQFAEHAVYRNFISKYFYSGNYKNETTQRLCSMLKKKFHTDNGMSMEREESYQSKIEQEQHRERVNMLSPNKTKETPILFMNDEAANKKIFLIEKILKNEKIQKRVNELLNIFGNLKHTKYAFTTEDIFTVAKKLHDMYKITQNARELRRKNGSFLFSNTKIDFILSQDKDTIGIVKKRLTFSNHMIEELMLSANKLVAIRQYFSKYREVSIFRSHNPTDALDVSDIIELLKTHGIYLTNCNLRQILKYLEENKHTFTNKKKNIFDVVSSFVKKKMKRAEYHTFKFIINNRMSTYHYALSFLLYTHFTSPIRRYPDILVHRIIKNIIADEYKLKNNLCSAEELMKNSQSTDIDILETICISCNECKTQSKKAQMDCEIAFFCLYLQKLEYPGYCKGIIMDIQRERSSIFFKSFAFESILYYENFQRTVQKVGKNYLKYLKNYVIIPNLNRHTITVILYDDTKTKILHKQVYERFGYIPLYLIPLNSMPPSYLLTVAFKNI